MRKLTQASLFLIACASLAGCEPTFRRLPYDGSARAFDIPGYGFSERAIAPGQYHVKSLYNTPEDRERFLQQGARELCPAGFRMADHNTITETHTNRGNSCSVKDQKKYAPKSTLDVIFDTDRCSYETTTKIQTLEAIITCN